MAFGAIQAVSDVMELVIKDFVHAADIFVAGISMIVVPAVISWFIYRCYKIMSGQVPDPMLSLITTKSWGCKRYNLGLPLIGKGNLKQTFNPLFRRF